MSINVFNENPRGLQLPELVCFENQHRDRFEKKMKRGFGKLDSIHMTIPELEKMCQILENMETPSAELLENPALPEFELVITKPFPSMRRNRIRFQKTVLPTVQIAKSVDDIDFGCTPQIDGYVSEDSNEEVFYYITMYTGHFYKDGEKQDMTSTMQTFHYANPELEAGIMDAMENYNHNLEAARVTKLAYLAIQEMMRNKPTVFVESKPGNTNSVAGGGSSNGKKNKVRVERVIRINAMELEKAIKGHKEIKCPCWGVMGHYRTYKSGKRVWVNPYKKGKERNNPNAYVAKEYLMEV